MSPGFRKMMTKQKLAPVGNVRLAVLIVAHNEGSIIVHLIHSLTKTLSPGDQVYVIADNCTDNTVDLAVGAGAIVKERHTGGAEGKGAALKWLVNSEKAALQEYDLTVILDADSQIPEGFVEGVKRISDHESVTQCFVQPVNFHDSPISTLSAFSEILEQKTFERIHAGLRWPVRLRGNGMIIPPQALIRVSDRIQTEVEDIALSLLFASARIPIRQALGVVVFDPKPSGTILAARQRARWFRGQWIAFWHYRQEGMKLLLQGPPGWSLLGTLFLKPRWLCDLLIFLMAVFIYGLIPVLTWILGAILVYELLCLVYTIISQEEKKEFIKAFLFFPAFILMWTRGFILAFKKSPWLRVRE
jgi:cellulose synthase/poly-beta-1,6-N-acetylglucosamine synthase-like glycosyltransferase